MRGLRFTLLLSVLILLFSCDTTNPSFDDTIPEVYSLDTRVVPAGMGVILVNPIGDNFEANEQVTLEAIPNEGYVFEKWEGALTGNTNPEFIIIDNDKSVTAHFFLRNYPLNISISGEGSVVEVIESRSKVNAENLEEIPKSKAGAIGLGQVSTQASHQTEDTVVNEKSSANTTVKLIAEPAQGWYFSQWEGDLTGDVNPEVITVDEEKNVTAVFLQEESEGFTIEIDVIGEGVVNKSPDRTFFNEGDELTLTANPDQGWSFVEWQGDITGTENSQTVTVDKDLSLTALFEVSEDPGMTITRQPTGSTAGVVMSPSPRVLLVDGLGEPIPDVEIGVSLNANAFAEGSTLLVNTDADGVAIFDNLSIETAASNYILTFDADEAEVLNVSSNPFGVAAAAVLTSKSSATVPDGGAGRETVISILARDEFDNLVPGIEDDFTVEVTGDNSASPTVVESDTPGEYQTTYTPENSGTDQISIQIGGEPIAGSPFESQVGNSGYVASNSTATVSSGTAGDEFVISISVRDQFGNSVSGVAEDITVNITGANSAAPSVSETSEPGEYRASYTPENAGRDRIAIQLGGEPINGSPFRPNVSPASADPANSTAEVPDGMAGEETTITILVNDRFGNSIVDVEGELSVQVAGVNDRSPSVTETNVAGQYRASYNPVNSGMDQILIQLDGEPINGSPFESSVAPANGDPSNSSVTVADGVAGEETVITIRVRDRFENNITNALGDLSVSVSGGNSASPAVNEGGSAGLYTASYIPEIAGRDLIAVQLNGEPINGSPFESNVSATSADPSISTISAEPDEVTVGEVSVITVELLDRFSNKVVGIPGNAFSVSVDGEATAGSVEETSDEGIYSFDVTSTKIGEVDISVSVGGIDIEDDASVEFEAGAPDELTIITQPEDTQSGQAVGGPPAVQVRDEYGNPVSGVDVSVREEGGTEFFEGTLTVSTNGSGTATFDNLVLNRFFGNFRLVFSVDGAADVTSERFQVSPFISSD
jgi:uncharacterized repeat protein (TIGR02543 family)